MVLQSELYIPDFPLPAIKTGILEGVVKDFLPPTLQRLLNPGLLFRGIVRPWEKARITGQVIQVKLYVRHNTVQSEMI
jgi:hypothetical protein